MTMTKNGKATLRMIKDDIKAAKELVAGEWNNDHYATFCLIYANGRMITITDEEIAAGVKIPLQHIVYALEENGDGEYDTEHEECDFMQDWTGEQKEDYYRTIEKQFNVRYCDAGCHMIKELD